MKSALVVANWKSNMSLVEAKQWIEVFAQEITEKELMNKTVLILPPFTLLSFLSSALQTQHLPFQLGAQTVSSFGKGAYTGDISAEQVKEFCSYVLIGHSERRTHHRETGEELQKQIDQTLSQGLTPLYCLSEEEQVPSSVSLVAYEPLFAIGSGETDTPEHAELIAKKLKEQPQVTTVLYGGSVTLENVSSFTHLSSIDGVLVGTQSLDPHQFAMLVKNA